MKTNAMKTTVNVNIGSQAFVLDEDAYETLRDYLDDIRARLSEDPTEIMTDIEMRLAELFGERVTTPMRVVTLEMVRAAMARMGEPAAFGERCDTPSASVRTSDRNRAEPAPRKLYRSTRDRSIAGVCGGLAEFFDVDSSAVRIAALLAVLLGGVSVWVYIILWIVVPENPDK